MSVTDLTDLSLFFLQLLFPSKSIDHHFFQVQPSQKLFESQLFHLLQFEMDPSKIIWLEYESFKIGNITVPKVKLMMMTLLSGMIYLFAESFQQDG